MLEVYIIVPGYKNQMPANMNAHHWEEQYKSQFQGFPIPTYIWQRRDEDFVLIEYNHAAVKFTDGKIKQFVGEKAAKLYADNPEIISDFNRCWKKKKHFSREMDYCHRTIDKNSWLDVTYTFVPPDKIMVYTQDITERKTADQELRQSEERYRAIFETAGVSLWELDIRRFFLKLKALEESGVVDLREYFDAEPDDVKKLLHSARIVDVNEATLRLFEAESKEELIAKVDSIFLPETYPVIRDTILAAAAGEKSFESEALNRTLKGKTLHVLMRMSLPAEQFLKHKMFVSVVDLTAVKQSETERLKLESQIQYAQKLESLGVLAGGIAHDFNNLLTGILGNANLVLAQLQPDAPLRERIHQIETASLHAADLTNQMLAYTGKGKFEKKPVRLSNMVREMEGLLTISLSKKATLIFDFADELPVIEADPSQMRQIIMNLITNASEALGDKSGTVTVTAGVVKASGTYLKETYLNNQLPAGDYVFLEVQDTGCGIDENTRAKIFDPFFTTKFAGRGLGLAAVLGIVRSHHGTIAVKSQPGAGTSFRVLFPSAGLTPSQMKKKSPVAEKSWRGDGMVLVIDDEEDVRTVLKNMLKKFGFDVGTASNGMEGIRVLQQYADEIVAVILDLTMPGISAQETCQAIQRVRSDLPIILTSGYTQEIAAEQCDLSQYNAYLQKPYSVNALQDTLYTVLYTA